MEPNGLVLPVRDNLSDQVVRYITQYITRNRLKPGDEIPSELRITSELGVSRGIVREAYRALATSGIVETGSGRTPRVSGLNNKAFVQMVEHGLATEQTSPEQVLELRCSIEVRAAELAAERRTEQDVEGMCRELESMAAAGQQLDAFVQADIRFHNLVAKATGNTLFRLLAPALRAALEISIRAGLERRNTAGLTHVIEMHKKIMIAIRDREPTRAGQLMAIHFDDARTAVRNLAQTPSELSA